jgi:hypothetical protein
MTFAGILACAAVVTGLAAALSLALILAFAGVLTRFLFCTFLTGHDTRLRDCVKRRVRDGGGLEARGASSHEAGDRRAGKQRFRGVGFLHSLTCFSDVAFGFPAVQSRSPERGTAEIFLVDGISLGGIALRVAVTSAFAADRRCQLSHIVLEVFEACPRNLIPTLGRKVASLVITSVRETVRGIDGGNDRRRESLPGEYSAKKDSN